jgi:DNA gyrase subunit A
MSNIEHIALHEAARYRYLNYAMSVITSRALPDVRDGLKPVQRRILYGMYHNLKLYPDGRFRKSAAVIGEVMAKYHPHGDSSIYDAMVRMAQPFSLRHTLIEGQGNFGSMDGDNAAAMRYTEAKLRPIALELLSELKQKTVAYRPNYDGQQFEPIVLPAQLPNILINGSEGIAVGMATKILPHNLRESIDACVALIDNPDLTNYDLCKKVKAPDFPTGGTILNTNTELKEIYATGQGGVRLRGNWELEKDTRKYHVVINEIPYSVNKATLVEKIGFLIAKKKVPQLVDVRDESTDEVRVVLVLKIPSGSSPEREMDLAMAYLCKHTPLQISLSMNMTCLVPTDNPEIAHPIKATLKELLRHWLNFRFTTIEKRFQYELMKLRERIHLLNGFATAFEILDELIALVRASDGRRDAHEKIIERFNFDDEQTEAILDLKLYKLAKLEIWAIQEELAEKRKSAENISDILSSQTNIWSVVRSELLELRKLYGEKRRSKIGGEEAQVEISDVSAYIIDEQTSVIVTKEGWIKRQGSYSDISKIRLREGDSILGISKASTKSTIGFFTNLGVSYVMRIVDIPSTTGYGEPLQKHFSFSDGERLCGIFVYDEKTLPTIDPEEGPYSPFLQKLRKDRKPQTTVINQNSLIQDDSKKDDSKKDDSKKDDSKKDDSKKDDSKKDDSKEQESMPSSTIIHDSTPTIDIATNDIATNDIATNDIATNDIATNDIATNMQNIQEGTEFSTISTISTMSIMSIMSMTSPIISTIIEDQDYPPPYGVAVTKKGRCIRFSILKHSELTNKTGRRFMRLDGKNDSVVATYLSHPHDWVVLHTVQRILSFPISDIPLVKSSGKGVYAIKLDLKDSKIGEKVVGFVMARNINDGILTKTSRGKEFLISPKTSCGRRGGKGKQVIKRGSIETWIQPLIHHHKIWTNTNIQNNSSTEASQDSISKAVSLVHQDQNTGKKRKNKSKLTTTKETSSSVTIDTEKKTEKKKTISNSTQTVPVRTLQISELKSPKIRSKIKRKLPSKEKLSKEKSSKEKTSKEKSSKTREIPIILSQPNDSIINKYQKTNSSKQEVQQDSNLDSSEDDTSVETFSSSQSPQCILTKSQIENTSSKNSFSTRKTKARKTKVRKTKVRKTKARKTTKVVKESESTTKAESKIPHSLQQTLLIPGLFDTDT